MRMAGIALIAGALFATPAFARTMTATRPGLMCEDADALARLTLPDGSSRASSPRVRPGDAEVKQRGGCIDIPPGAHVSVLDARKNTSVIEYVTRDGPPQGRIFTVPNIDFTDDPGPVLPPAIDASVGGCHKSGRMKVTGTIHMRTLPPDPEMNRQKPWTYPVMTFDRPVCVIDEGFGEVRNGKVASIILLGDVYHPLHEGQHVTLTGDLGPPDNVSQPPEPLMLDVGE